MSHEDRQAQKARDVARQNARFQKWNNMATQPAQPRVHRPQQDSYTPRQTYRKTGS